jgi:hypothetical protein
VAENRPNAPFAAYIYVMQRALLMHEGVGGIRVLQNFFGENNFSARGDNVGHLDLTIADSKFQVRERKARIAKRGSPAGVRLAHPKLSGHAKSAISSDKYYVCLE